MSTLPVDIWSDVVCPWCYIGKRRIEAALGAFEHASSVELRWHAFELDPTSPAVLPAELSHAERLAKKYGMSVRDAELRIQRVVELGAEDGIEFRFDISRSGNTFDAHRVLALARERGVQAAVKERFMRGYFTEGAVIGEREELVRMASEVGLDASEVRTVLAGPAFSKEVRADQDMARAQGISGVPFFVFAGKYGVSGAQAAGSLLRVLEKAWSEL